MRRRVIFLTHADVVIDPLIPVPEWPLNETGRDRHRAFSSGPIISNVSSVFCSAEQKARDGAALSAHALGLQPTTIDALGENDRSSTGYLPNEAFERAADQFFSNPEVSYRGWERAVDAQARIVGAVRAIVSLADGDGDILIVSHGGVANLLYCHLMREPIARRTALHPRGGNWFSFAPDLRTPPSPWGVI